MTDPRITIDRTVQVSREEYDRMADQRDEFRRLAYSLKGALADARSALAGALHNAGEVRRADELAADEAWFELTCGLEMALDSATAELARCPKLTG